MIRLPANGSACPWTLLSLQEFIKRVPDGFPNLQARIGLSGLDVERSQFEMIEWARQSAGYQISLYAAESTAADSNTISLGVVDSPKI